MTNKTFEQARARVNRLWQQITRLQNANGKHLDYSERTDLWHRCQRLQKRLEDANFQMQFAQ